MHVTMCRSTPTHFLTEAALEMEAEPEHVTVQFVTGACPAEGAGMGPEI